jgi:hypothetical protein
MSDTHTDQGMDMSIMCRNFSRFALRLRWLYSMSVKVLCFMWVAPGSYGYNGNVLTYQLLLGVFYPIKSAVP